MSETPLTAEREQEIRERETAATPGPWGTYHENPTSDYSRLIDIAADLQDTGTGYRCRRYIGQLESQQIDNDPAHKAWDAGQDNKQSAADAEFIAHARQDVPALLAEIERMRAERARYRIAWRMAYQRAQARGWAADRAIARDHGRQQYMDELLAQSLGAQMQRNKLRAELAARPTRVAVLRAAARKFEAECPDEGGTLPLCMCHVADPLREMANTAERDDAGKDTRPAGESTRVTSPNIGDRYDSRHGGEGVTVTRLWSLDNGHPAVDFEYRDGASSALPLDSFHRAYQPAQLVDPTSFAAPVQRAAAQDLNRLHGERGDGQ